MPLFTCSIQVITSSSNGDDQIAARECVLPPQFTPLRRERYTGVLRDLRLARLLIILSKSFTNRSSTLPIELINLRCSTVKSLWFTVPDEIATISLISAETEAP